MSLSDLLTGSTLPLRFRGYDRKTTDDLLREIESSYRVLLAERDEARASLDSAQQRVVELEHKVARHREHTQAISDALVAATQMKVEAEEAARAIKGEAKRAAAAIRRRAEQDADSIVREAESRAQAVVDEVEIGYRRSGKPKPKELGDAKERLATLMRDLLDRARKIPSDVTAEYRSPTRRD